MGDIYFVDDSEYKNPETLALPEEIIVLIQ